jgi:hypothetical protein
MKQHLFSLAVLTAFTIPGAAWPVLDAAEARGPAIRLNQKEKNDPRATFEVTGLDPAALAKLAQAGLKREQWTALFGVYVAGRAKDPPPVLGSYAVRDGVLRFTPRFPLARGLRYRAVFDPARWPGGQMKQKPVVATFLLPRPAAVATTVVQQVYPSGETLPENQLRFYIHFSAPMSRGDVYRHIKLLNASGRPVDQPFLELDDELWDPRGQRFTLFVDPGRIKRGLKPREDLGPVLEKGKTYTLVIDRKWTDAEDNPLKETYRKTFKVTVPVDLPVQPKDWKLDSPAAGTRKPLAVRFPRPLDHALLQRLLWVTGPRGEVVAGTVAVSHAETRWQFTPKRPWQAGAYHLAADTRLEDLAGNNIERPFEVDVFRPVQRRLKSKTVRVPFQVK